MKLKITIASIILIVAALIISFFNRNDSWQIKLDKDQFWDFAFIQESIAIDKQSSQIEIDWQQIKEDIVIIPETNSNKRVILKSVFDISNINSIDEAILEIPKNYVVEIYFNKKKFFSVEKGLITSNTSPSGEQNQLQIEGHWQNRKLFIDQEQVTTFLKNGENTIWFVIDYLDELKKVKTSKISFMVNHKWPYSLITPNEYSPESSFHFSHSSLPIIKIDTRGQAILNDPKIEATLEVINQESQVNSIQDQGTRIPIKIEHRGFTSLSFSKKSYGFKTCSTTLQDSIVSILGLPAESSWILYGPYKDRSLLRNALTYKLFEKTGNYSPRTKMLELVINDNYQGLYLLTEKIKISPSRLAIDKLHLSETTDSTKAEGGYILEIDRNKWKGFSPPDEEGMVLSSFDLEHPKGHTVSASIQEKVQDQYTGLEKAIFTGQAFPSTFDTLSFVDFIIMNELSKNVDAYRLSTFLYNKNINDSIPKFYAGPIWDFNYAWGLVDYNDASNPEGFVYSNSEFVPFIWRKLMTDSQFTMAVNNRYKELRTSVLSNKSITITIDSLYKSCKQPATRNFQKWIVIGNESFEPNYFTGKSHQEEVEHLKAWIEQRLEYLDSEFDLR